MRSFMAFFKKEWMELVRSRKLLILAIVFSAFGIMNPAIAKLTPAILEMASADLAGQGLIIGAVEVTAVDCWMQFYKNLSILMIIFVITFSGIFTSEYRKGSLLLVTTKGLSKIKIYYAKLITMAAIWSFGYAVTAAVTYVYADIYWDNGIMRNLFEGVALPWLLGIWLCCLMAFFSTFASSSGQVLLGIGGVVVLCVFLAIIPGAADYLPTSLADLTDVVSGKSDFTSGKAIIITVLTAAAAVSVGTYCTSTLDE